MKVYINRKNNKLFTVENDSEYNNLELDDLKYQGVEVMGVEFVDKTDSNNILRKLLTHENKLTIDQLINIENYVLKGSGIDKVTELSLFNDWYDESYANLKDIEKEDFEDFKDTFKDNMFSELVDCLNCFVDYEKLFEAIKKYTKINFEYVEILGNSKGEEYLFYDFEKDTILDEKYLDSLVNDSFVSICDNDDDVLEEVVGFDDEIYPYVDDPFRVVSVDKYMKDTYGAYPAKIQYVWFWSLLVLKFEQQK